MMLVTNEIPTTSLRNDSTISNRKVPKQLIIDNPIDLSKESTKSFLTINSVAKAALVAIGTIGAYYLAKTTNFFSYIGRGSENPKDVNGNEIVEVKNEEQSLVAGRSLEKVEQTGSLFTTRSLQSYDDEKIVEFDEMEIEEFTIQEFNDLPEVKRRAGNRRSITIQNSISDQNVTVGNLFELTINGTTIFNSNTIFVDATNIPAWITSPSLSPTLKGSYDTPDFAYGIALLGNYAYVAARTSGLQIIDITDPANPTFKGSYDTPGRAEAISLSGNYAYVIEGYSLQIIDISDPANPTFKGSSNLPSWGSVVALSGNYAYISDGGSGLQIKDISDPANPTFKGSYDTPDWASGVALSGNYAYIADGSSGLQIIDISDPANPTFKGSYDTPGSARKIALSGNYAYVADSLGLQIIDISDPANPTFKGSCAIFNQANEIALLGNYAYVADSSEYSVQIIDIRDSANPTFKGLCRTKCQAYGIALLGNYAYVAAEGSGLEIISTNLDKLTLSGTPSVVGTYSVDIRGCNELNECVTDSFDIIVTDPTDSSSTTLIIITSIAACAGTVCVTGLCGLSIGGIIAFMRYRRKNMKEQQIVKIVPSLKEEQNGDDLQPVIQQQNPEVFTEYDLNEKGEKVPTASDHENEVELDTMPQGLKIASASELPELFEEIAYDEAPSPSQEIMQDPYVY